MYKASLFLLATLASGQVRNLMYQGLSGEINGTCSTNYRLHGIIPHSPGRGYPLALYILGTNEPFESRVSQAFIEKMSQLGFAAFVVAYPNRTDSGCGPIRNKSTCIFGTTTGTAVDVISHQAPMVDTSRIVVAGISQGAQIATISGDYNDGIRAA